MKKMKEKEENKLKKNQITYKESFKKIIFEDKVIFINKSGYIHAPYLVSWVDAYESCGVDILDKKQLKEKYNIIF